MKWIFPSTWGRTHECAAGQTARLGRTKQKSATPSLSSRHSSEILGKANITTHEHEPVRILMEIG